MENKTVQAVVIRFFIDKHTRQNVQEGQLIELSEERFMELSEKGKVDFAPDPTKKKPVTPPIAEKPVYAKEPLHKPTDGKEAPGISAKDVPAKSAPNDATKSLF